MGLFRAGDPMASPSLRSTNLLSDLPERVTSALLANAKPVKLAEEEILFLSGDPGDGFYQLNEGLLKVSMASPKGAERILAILGPGSIVGDMAVIDGRPRSASVSALRDCKLSFISRASFETVAAKNPEVYKHLLHLLAARLRDTDQVVAVGTFLPVKGRVARALLDLAKAFGNDVGGGRIVIRQKLSQSDVAAIAGIARENVSRILNEWMRLKMITRLSGYYCIEGTAKLEKELRL
jgi:CRP/FNR family transcriptional regulator, cyclic AMP receptor protein